MLQLSVIGLIILSMVIVRSDYKVAGIIDFIAALLILLFKVVPGRADGFDWIFIIILFLCGGVFYLTPKIDGLTSGYENP